MLATFDIGSSERRVPMLATFDIGSSERRVPMLATFDIGSSEREEAGGRSMPAQAWGL
jgi:hypothetical protein